MAAWCQDWPRRILILGGPRFAGRAIVEAALGRGDTVTLFNRGITNHGLFPGVETGIGDQTEDLLPLGQREFAAVVDVACYDPATARVSAEALKGRVGRYVFVSTVSVYASQATTEAQREDAPLAELKPDVADPLENYGANKALCEAVIREAYGERALIGRPGLRRGPPRPDRPVPLLAKADRARRPGARAGRRRRPAPGHRRAGPGRVPPRPHPPRQARRGQPVGSPAAVRHPPCPVPHGDVQRRRADLGADRPPGGGR